MFGLESAPMANRAEMCSVVLFRLKTEKCPQPLGLSRNLTQRNVSESQRCSKDMNFLEN